jgi:hypothetical protein
MLEMPGEHRNKLRIGAPQTQSAGRRTKGRPGSQRRKPKPDAAASVPLAMATGVARRRAG